MISKILQHISMPLMFIVVMCLILGVQPDEAAISLWEWVSDK